MKQLELPFKNQKDEDQKKTSKDRKEVLKDLLVDVVARLTSRSFVILVVTALLLIKGAIDQNTFMVINGFSLGKSVLDNVKK